MPFLTGNTRIHLNTERWRVCEAYFSPAMAGVDSAGLGEIIQNLIPSFIESRSKSCVLDFLDERREVIQVGVLILVSQAHDGHLLNITVECVLNRAAFHSTRPL